MDPRWVAEDVVVEDVKTSLSQKMVVVPEELDQVVVLAVLVVVEVVDVRDVEDGWSTGGSTGSA